MFWRVVPLNLAGNATGLSWYEALIQAIWPMNVQVVYDENDAFSFWVDYFYQIV